jgi:two-component system phosphate regulon sensor histidine kinase PhoR
VKGSWGEEIWRLVGVLALCVLLGLVTGQVRELLIIGLGVGVAWQLYNMHRLLKWLNAPDGGGERDVGGIWGEIYYRVSQLQRRNRKRKRKLGKMLAQFRASAEAMPDAAVALGPHWEILWFNDAASRLLGLRQLQDTGRSVLNLLRAPEFHAYVHAGSFDHSLEISAPRNTGQKLAMRIIPHAGNQRLLLAQDVTERYRLERIRKDFVANASHELRTPLTVIGGFVEHMRHEGTDCATRWARPLALMEQQTARMQRIIEDLLLLSGLESGQTGNRSEEVDVGAMIDEMVDEAVAAAGPDAPEITADTQSDARVLGDPQHLRSAFSNLVMNAVQHTPAGGGICIVWRLQDGSQGVFEVRDTGEGIPPEHLPRLTERFYRVDVARSRRRGGTGLGLAIVKHVLQNHDARLEIESEVGVGSTFRCVFPSARLVLADNEDTGRDAAE